MQHNKRILDFLNSNGINNLLLEPIEQDASSRRYFRIKNGKNILLMDSHSEHNNNYEFIMYEGTNEADKNKFIQNNINGVPSLNKKVNNELVEYNGPRTTEAINQWLEN